MEQSNTKLTGPIAVCFPQNWRWNMLRWAKYSMPAGQHRTLANRKVLFVLGQAWKGRAGRYSSPALAIAIGRSRISSQHDGRTDRHCIFQAPRRLHFSKQQQVVAWNVRREALSQLIEQQRKLQRRLHQAAGEVVDVVQSRRPSSASRGSATRSRSGRCPSAGRRPAALGHRLA